MECKLPVSVVIVQLKVKNFTTMGTLLQQHQDLVMYLMTTFVWFAMHHPLRCLYSAWKSSNCLCWAYFPGHSYSSWSQTAGYSGSRVLPASPTKLSQTLRGVAVYRVPTWSDKGWHCCSEWWLWFNWREEIWHAGEVERKVRLQSYLSSVYRGLVGMWKSFRCCWSMQNYCIQ